MKIELRNVKYAAFASQETSCFEATVYLDDAKAGTVRNDGHGGCNFYHPHELGQRLQAYAATLPEEASEFLEDNGKPMMIQPDADIVIGDVLSAYMASRDLQRLLKTKIVFAKGGKILGTKKIPAPQLALLLTKPEEVRTRYGAEALLNTMPFDEALALYRKCA